VSEVKGTSKKKIYTSRADAHGIATFPGRSDHEIIYLAKHPNFAISSTIAFLDQDRIAIDLPLKPKRPLQSRVTDKDGTPIEGALIDLKTRSNSDFYADWNTQTGADGTFLWEQAPHFDFFLHIEANGFHPIVVSAQYIRNAGSITLQQAEESDVHLRAAVLDADTGEPLKQFDYAFVKELIDPFNDPQEGHNGIIKLDSTLTELTQDILSGPAIQYYICIRTPGYKETYSRSVSTNEINPTLNIRVEAISSELSFRGLTVVTPTGKPASNASLSVVTDRSKPWIQRRGKKVHFGTIPGSTTKELDLFGMIPPLSMPLEFRGLFIYHDSGTLALGEDKIKKNSKTLHLQAPGSVRGTLKIAGDLITNRRVSIRTSLSPTQLVRTSFNVQTDDAGRFYFEKVPPVNYQLSINHPDFSVGFVTECYQESVIVESGKETVIDYSNAGRRIVGRLAATPTGRVVDWRHGRYHLRSTQSKAPIRFRPRREQFVNFKRFSAINNLFVRNTQAQTASPRNNYYLNIEDGGFFYLDGVPSGDYEFELSVLKPQAKSIGNPFTNEKLIGQLVQKIRIPKGLDGSTFHVGAIDIPIPDTRDHSLPNVRSINQLGFLSSDRIRGRTAVLHLWASWAEDGSEWWNTLREIQSRYPKEQSLTVMSFNLDRSEKEMNDFLDNNPHPWPIGHLSPRQGARILRQFGIKTLPATLVVDQTGRVSMNTGSAETLERLINASLSSPPNPAN